MSTYSDSFLETITFDDESETLIVYNEVLTSNAIAFDGEPDFSGSTYNLVLTSDGIAADEITRLSTPIPLTSNGVAADTLNIIRVERLTSNAIAADSFNQLKSYATLILESLAEAADTITAMPTTLNLSSAGVAADTLVMFRVMSLTSNGVATDTLTLVGKFNLSLSSSGIASDTLDLRRSIYATSNAVGADTLTLLRHARETLVSDAIAADTISQAKGYITLALESDAVAEALINQLRMTGTLVLESNAEAQDSLRLPASALPALWSNTTTGAAATWEGLPFNSMVEVSGAVYGASKDGIGVLTPKVNDDGLKIEGYVVWDLDDMGSNSRKRIGHIYVAGSAIKPFVVTVTCHQGSFEYQTRLPKGEHATNYRADTGRGLDSQYYRIAVKAPDYFEVKGIVVDHLPTTRRI